MTISERYFTGVENLAIRVRMDSFGSDPDLFISRVRLSTPAILKTNVVLSDLNNMY